MSTTLQMLMQLVSKFHPQCGLIKNQWAIDCDLTSTLQLSWVHTCSSKTWFTVLKWPCFVTTL
jgi:hypothetical protein